MSARDSWAALSARIRGLQEASELTATLLSANNDSVGVIVDLGNHASAILSDLTAFKNSLGKAEQYAIDAINRVATKVGPLLREHANSSTETRQIYIRSALVMIVALEGEISYLLRDSEEAIRSRSERAFIHLNRSIMVDSRVRESWTKAYDDGEVDCERLGAVHLLSHGIWAFKVDAAGGRTDLVLQEPLTDVTGIRRSGDGLVLTEWKKHSVRDDAGELFDRARQQALRYAAGVLAGAELTRYRYAIVVSTNALNVPDDLEIDGKVFRHINIVTSPKTPSKQK